MPNSNDRTQNTLVIGAGRGLGKYIAETLQCASHLRGDPIEDIAAMDTIIYCAADARFSTPYSAIVSSLESNLFLLDKALKIAHKKFIFISSADVYPNDGGKHKENEELYLEALSGGYATFKLAGEALASKLGNNPLILRPTSLFGSGMRQNNIVRLLSTDSDAVTLKKNSTFNCITYEMLSDFIKTSMDRSLTGIFNCAAADTVSLEDVARYVGYSGAYGEFEYQAPMLDNSKICAIEPSFSANSAEILFPFLDYYS